MDGSPADDIADKIVMSVASIQNDNSVGTYKPPRQGPGDGYAVASAPLFLDVYVMFVSCFTGPNYGAGLGLLSRIVSFFQETPILENMATADGSADQMDRLAVEYVSLDFAQSNNLATVMGLKGQPFVVYRLRRLPFDGPAISGIAPAVRSTPRPQIESSG
ncbi:MAG TPA: Pvc16 family protein [Allosphingosinicella sp.]|jgi:hypothetical protein